MIEQTAYPRVYVSAATHKKVKKLAEKMNLPMNKIGDKIVKAGLMVWEEK